jgi:hypothetical protein
VLKTEDGVIESSTVAEPSVPRIDVLTGTDLAELGEISSVAADDSGTVYTGDAVKVATLVSSEDASLVHGKVTVVR